MGMIRQAFWEDEHRDAVVESTVAEALVERLAELGVEQAYGVDGGAIALVYDALALSTIDLFHYRHENGAAEAALEASLASGKPTVTFATTGPGLLNTVAGLRAARHDGGRVILLSGATGGPQKGRWATQETSSYTLPMDALYSSGRLFDFAVRMEEASELNEVLRRLAQGLAGAGGFVAHIGIPVSLAAGRVDLPRRLPELTRNRPGLIPEDAARYAKLLSRDGFAVWVGSGARSASTQVRALIERCGAYAFCSPRGKGIVPEDHPRFVGVTGVGGHQDDVVSFLQQHRPARILVLGSRLGEATSLWDPDLVPEQGFLHVDLDPQVPGAAYPEAPVQGIQADIAAFLESLLPHLGEKSSSRVVPLRKCSAPSAPLPSDSGPVRPRVLMAVLQKCVVRGSDAPILAENGRCAAWCVHHLRFAKPGRLRSSPAFGADGHAVAGVVGVAQALHGKAVAVVSDHSMLISNEISTAVQYQNSAVWIVLNDGGYRGQESQHEVFGLSSEHLTLPTIDFVAMARSLGADGIRVDRENALEDALELAMSAEGPFVVEVMVDPQVRSPLEEIFDPDYL